MLVALTVLQWVAIPTQGSLILSLRHLLLPITSFAGETPSIPTCTPLGLGDVQFSLQLRNRLSIST